MKSDSPLGKPTAYAHDYAPELLFPIARGDSRLALGIARPLPFDGVDIWNAWELTWLSPSGKPEVAVGEIRVPADSPSLVESKSLKLYLNSLAMSRFESATAVTETIAKDLSAAAGAAVTVQLQSVLAAGTRQVDQLPGSCIDLLDADCDAREVDASLLQADPRDIVDESLHSHLLRSLCPVTAQPDAGSLLVSYQGPRIDPRGLLRYIVSFRQHNDFHEACVERIFVEISERCRPSTLSVHALYQRRGGIDINPFRSNHGAQAAALRLWRQ
jgi:7-cyano-7-deazaguanine reductase